MLGRGETTFDVVCRLERDSGYGFAMTLSFNSRLESLRHDIEIVPSRFCMLNGLLGCSMSVRGASIRSWSTPSPLASSKDPVYHVYPIEKRIHDEHDRIQPSLEAPESDAKIDHQKPVQAERHSQEADWKIRDLV